ncbi:glycosyltransferase [Thermodesulfobacteriota bacterium]
MVDTQRPLNILQVSTVDLGGGAEGSAWNLFQAYRNMGHNSWLAVGSKQSHDPDVFLIPNYKHLNWCAKMCLIAQSRANLIAGRRSIGRLIGSMIGLVGDPYRWSESNRGHEDFNYPGTSHLLNLSPRLPDIVHCHNLHGGYFDLRVLPWLSRQVPVIINLRDAWLLSGHCAHSFNCERWKTGCGQCPDLTIYPAIRKDATAYNWHRKRSIYEKSNLYITAISKWLMDKVKVSMLHGLQYRVIYNGINMTVFRPGSQAKARRALNLPDKAKIILMIAHNKFKDYSMMEAAVGNLIKTTKTEIIGVCLGKNGTDKVSWNGRFIYHGFERNQERMALYYRASDVFIHAARAEAFGKTITEAMACGVPVVATAVGGIPEQIENERTGILVPPGDSASMSAAIDRLLADSNLYHTIRQRGVDAVRRNFGLERQVKSFSSWYHEIIKDWKLNRYGDLVTEE